MTIYKHILVPIDLSNESDKLIERALQLAEKEGAAVSLLHVIEQPPAYGGNFGGLELSGVQDEMQGQASEQLAETAAKHGIPSERCHLEHGVPKMSIHEFADHNDVDLVVIGSHGRHGVQLLLGSTANAVLHGANCDVLAIRV